MLRQTLQLFTPFARRYSVNSDKHLALQTQLSEQAAILRTNNAFLQELARARIYHQEIKVDLAAIIKQNPARPEMKQLSVQLKETTNLLLALDVGIDNIFAKRQAVVAKMRTLVAEIKKECAEVTQDQPVSGVKPK